MLTNSGTLQKPANIAYLYGDSENVVLAQYNPTVNVYLFWVHFVMEINLNLQHKLCPIIQERTAGTPSVQDASAGTPVIKPGGRHKHASLLSGGLNYQNGTPTLTGAGQTITGAVGSLDTDYAENHPHDSEALPNHGHPGCTGAEPAATAR